MRCAEVRQTYYFLFLVGCDGFQIGFGLVGTVGRNVGDAVRAASRSSRVVDHPKRGGDAETVGFVDQFGTVHQDVELVGETSVSRFFASAGLMAAMSLLT